jgi:hypothetical protein
MFSVEIGCCCFGAIVSVGVLLCDLLARQLMYSVSYSRTEMEYSGV